MATVQISDAILYMTYVTYSKSIVMGIVYRNGSLNL